MVFGGSIALLAFAIFTPWQSRGDITAASASQADVQAAINAAVAGETVFIPAGTAAWGANASSLSINKVITLAGAGQDLTTIDISPTAGSWDSGVIGIYAAATGYSVYRNNNLAGNTTTETTYTDTGLTTATSYAYSVNTYDAAGNTSARSSAINATTLSANNSNSSSSSSGFLVAALSLAIVSRIALRKRTIRKQ